MKKFQLLNFFKKPEIMVVALSLGVTSLISSIIAFGGLVVFGNFWGTFVIAFGIQIIVFAIVNTFLQRKDLLEGTKIINEQLQAISRFTINISCAYCKQASSVPIVLNNENRFKCESCNQVNGIKMQFFATQITTPLKKVLLPVGDSESIEFKTDLS